MDVTATSGEGNQSSRRRRTLEYSVVIPAHNEAENLPALLHELHYVLGQFARRFEIIVVDDGSTDETPLVLSALQEEIPQLVNLRLTRNYGQSAAFDAGFRTAQGEVLITLDADGQNPPAEIPKLLPLLSDSDMVCGWRQNRQDLLSRRYASKFANTFRRWVLQDGIHDSGCSLKIFRAEVVARLPLFHGMHRFFPALALMQGFRVSEIKVAHSSRELGRSHYGIWNRMWGTFWDLCMVYWMKSRQRIWRVEEVPHERSFALGTRRVDWPEEIDIRHTPSRIRLPH